MNSFHSFINNIIRDLEEAEDQYQMALRTHLINIDTLIKLHDARLYALERNFQQELKILQEEFYQEKEYMIMKFQTEKLDLKSIIEAIEEQEEQRMQETQQKFEQMREEIKARNHEEIDTLRVSLDDQIKDLEQEFENEHIQYLSRTQQRSHEFKEKSKNDLSLNADIQSYKLRIDNLQNMIKHWRAKTKQLHRETEERNRLLQDEKLSIQKHYQQLKSRIKIYRSTQNQRLLHLSQAANQCKQVLKDKLEVARRILQLTDLSRRMETLSEQILPFATNLDSLNNQEIIYRDALEGNLGEEAGASNPANTQQLDTTTSGTHAAAATTTLKTTKSSRQSRHPHSNNLLSSTAQYVAHQSSVWSLPSATQSNKEFVTPMDRLSNFYRHYNKILLDNIAIAKEKERLQLENAQLQDLIQQYMDGTKISNEILRDDNPLFVVNGRYVRSFSCIYFLFFIPDFLLVFFFFFFRANLNHDPPVRRVKPLIQDAVEIRNATVRLHQARMVG
jgi:dynein regulatory complex subunit 2